jgi:hypothetical protein
MFVVMRYLKKFESINDKEKEYEKFIDKVVIYKDFRHNDKIYVARYKGLVMNDSFIKIENLEWDDFYQGYNLHTELLHGDDFEILSSFDTAKEAFDMLKNMDKYNL